MCRRIQVGIGKGIVGEIRVVDIEGGFRRVRGSLKERFLSYYPIFSPATIYPSCQECRGFLPLRTKSRWDHREKQSLNVISNSISKQDLQETETEEKLTGVESSSFEYRVFRSDTFTSTLRL